MAPQPRTQIPSNEANVQLAKLAIEQGQFRSIREDAKAYNVSRKTLKRCTNGIALRSDCVPNSKKLTKKEEKAIINHTIDVDARGFQLNHDILRDMANKLLTDRDAPQVGVNWPYKFHLDRHRMYIYVPTMRQMPPFSVVFSHRGATSGEKLSLVLIRFDYAQPHYMPRLSFSNTRMIPLFFLSQIPSRDFQSQKPKFCSAVASCLQNACNKTKPTSWKGLYCVTI